MKRSADAENGASNTNSAPAKVLKGARKQAVRKVNIDAAASTGGDGTEYNIWYNKWSGGDARKEGPKKATTRLNPKRDSGLTRADAKAEGTKQVKTSASFCLHFARGACHAGAECTFLHRVPNEQDEVQQGVDCFGRERWAEDRYDMGGIGSFSRENFTLYCGRIGDYKSSEEMEKVVRKHFGQWGQIATINILWDKHVAFVKYKLRQVAEFAKEAMSNQSLDRNEMMNVRWASEDPNPKAKRDFVEAAKEALEERQKAQKMMAEQNIPVPGGSFYNYYGQPMAPGSGGYGIGGQPLQDQITNGDASDEQQAQTLTTEEEAARAEAWRQYFASQAAAKAAGAQQLTLDDKTQEERLKEYAQQGYDPAYLRQWQEYYDAQQKQAGTLGESATNLGNANSDSGKDAQEAASKVNGDAKDTSDAPKANPLGVLDYASDEEDV